MDFNRVTVDTEDGVAILPSDAHVSEAFLAMPHKGAAILVDEEGRLAGLITSGDLRRGMERFGGDFPTRGVSEIMTRDPLTITPHALAAEGLRRFQEFFADINEIPVVDEDHRPVGMLMLKDLLRAGLA